MKACIVDDEKKGRESLQTLLRQYCPQVEVIGQADSVINAYQLINKEKPDLVFLDIEMPQGSGFELLKKFEKITFKTIFVTAHKHYAIKAIRFAALDYLLKPLDVDELVEAVNHAGENNHTNMQAHYYGLFENLANGKAGKIALPIKEGVVFIEPQNIIRLEADGAYTQIFTGEDRFTAAKNIKEYEQLLSEYSFFRAHHSHLINLKHVKRFNKSEGYFAIMSDGTSVEIARRKKDQFLQLMNL